MRRGKWLCQWKLHGSERIIEQSFVWRWNARRMADDLAVQMEVSMVRVAQVYDETVFPAGLTRPARTDGPPPPPPPRRR